MCLWGIWVPASGVKALVQMMCVHRGSNWRDLSEWNLVTGTRVVPRVKVTCPCDAIPAVNEWGHWWRARQVSWWVSEVAWFQEFSKGKITRLKVTVGDQRSPSHWWVHVVLCVCRCGRVRQSLSAKRVEFVCPPYAIHWGDWVAGAATGHTRNLSLAAGGLY